MLKNVEKRCIIFTANIETPKNNFIGVDIMSSTCHHSAISVSISALNAEVSGSCLPVDIKYSDGKSTRFLVDCGMFQERQYRQLNAQKFPFDSRNYECLLITHCHADHYEKAPILFKEGFDGIVYTTATTKKLMYRASLDSYRIMMADSKNKKCKPLYSESDVQAVMKHTVGYKIGETIDIDDRVNVTFLDNGHILGATSFFVQISYLGQERCILFSGDYKGKSIWKEVKKIPEWVRKKNKTVVCESTYGNVDSKDVEIKFKNDILKLIKSGKSVLIFVFAQGRAQEVLYELKKSQNSGQLSKSVSIYLDGNLAQENTHIYQVSDEVDEEKRDFLPDNFHTINKENRESVIQSDEQRIILTTSGMGDHGPAQIYIPALIENENFAFYFTGFVSNDSLAYRILHSKKIKLNEKEYNVNAEVYTTTEFSAHAKADQLLEYLRECGKVDCVLLNHGEKNVQKIFGQRILDEGICEQVESLSEHTAILGEHGIIRVIGSKFYSVRKIKKEGNKQTKQSLRRYQLKVCRH